MRAPEEDPPPELSVWRRRSVLLSGALLAALGFLGLVIALTGPDTRPPGAPRPNASTAEGVKPTPGSAGRSACGLTDGPTGSPQQAPAASWRLTGRMAVPTAAAVGPGRTVDGVKSCYANSTAGALFAAVNVVASGALPQTRLAAIRQLVLDGPGKAATLRTSETPSGDNDLEIPMQVAGFRVGSVDRTHALLTLALRVQTGQRTLYVSGPLELRWSEGDWKVVAPPDGEVFAGFSQVSDDLSGFTAWSGA